MIIMLHNTPSYVKRDILYGLIAHLTQPEMTLITGSRQVGKTVLLDMLHKELQKQDKPQVSILRYNLDLEADWHLFQDQTAFIALLKERSQQHFLYVLIDEAQKAKEAARFFKGVYDSQLPVKLILTGSASFELKAKLKESMAGRKRIFHVHPFSFLEYVRAHDEVLAQLLERGAAPSPHSLQMLIEHYKQYMVYGGYPRVVLEKSPTAKLALLQEIYSSYINNDIVGFLNIRRKKDFGKLAKLLAAQTGQLVNIQELSNSVRISAKTVQKYLEALEDTFIITYVSPLYRNARQEVVKAGKVYFNDLGFRHALLGTFESFDERVDKGSVLENAVFQELLQSADQPPLKIQFWRTLAKTEIDFVVTSGTKLIPIEVKAQLSRMNIPRALQEFAKKFGVREALLATMHKPQNPFDTRGALHVGAVYPFELHTQLDLMLSRP
ncbi:MAG: hypothetical protein A2666_02240 [Parcubacteria group bacterium RIFCSPHIGHO2_01_FULL_47_10b]|nr:MAG: hypothetical protein A2666_02240 [Parcubacteria group bacterium RIFCSPHIGHO2_01_FULL_47_10b]